MAKSSSFFGLRTGSTKSLTFQVYRGQQITKDRVSRVSNPQSSKQMQQRLLVPMVANARQALAGLVDHSWEGVDYGWKSLKEFSSRNLRNGVLSPISYVPKGMQDPGVANYIISSGSLQSVGVTYVIGEHSGFSLDIKEGIGPSSSIDNNESAFTFLTQVIPQLQKGDQLTFLAERELGGTQYIYNVNGQDMTASRHDFVISRFVLDADADNGDDFGIQTTEKNSMKVLDEIHFGMFNVDFSYNQDGGLTSCDVSLSDELAGSMVALGVIVSRKVGNVYKRSFARLKTITTAAGQVSYKNAEPTYIKTASNSDLYLNEGTDSTGITGGTDVTPVYPM